MRIPIVRTTRQPPTIVPKPITIAAETIIHVSISSSPTCPPVPARSSAIASAMIPIVFCASFVPWLKAMNAADRIWPRPKTRETVARRTRAKIR